MFKFYRERVTREEMEFFNCYFQYREIVFRHAGDSQLKKKSGSQSSHRKPEELVRIVVDVAVIGVSKTKKSITEI